MLPASPPPNPARIIQIDLTVSNGAGPGPRTAGYSRTELECAASERKGSAVSTTAMAAHEEGLLDRVAALLPMLRENAPRCEAQRRVVDENIEALTDAGIFRMTVGRHYGGYESSVATQFDALALIATACPSTSWVATILTAMLWNAGMFPDEAQDEVFADPRVRVASVFAPGGQAREAPGGVVVSGRWPFNTGALNSHWAILTAIVTGAGEPAPASLLIPYAQLRILDDWQATGMAGTGSNTTVADEVFVPSHRILPLAAQLGLDLPSERNHDSAYWNVSLVAFLIAQATGTPVGLARGALDAFMERLPGRAITYTDYADQSAAPVTHLQVGEAAMTLFSADAHAREAVALVAGTPGRDAPLEVRARIRAHSGTATALARTTVDRLFAASGASAIQASVPIQRYQRDIQALANHALLAPATAVELYGRIACGQPPNTPFV
jgi:alkylation response protein AidB-like acyl-CoA dehydrogenase